MPESRSRQQSAQRQVLDSTARSGRVAAARTRRGRRSCDGRPRLHL